MAQELCFMSNVTAEVWASVAQTVVATAAIVVAALAIRWQVRTQANREVNQERAALKSRLHSLCLVGRLAQERIQTAFKSFDTPENAAHWVWLEDIYSDRAIILTALQSVRTEELPEAGQVLAVLATIQAYDAAQMSLDYPRATGGLLETPVLAKITEVLEKHLAIMDQNLSQLESSRDALTT